MSEVYRSALIVGAGSGLGSAIGRALAEAGLKVGLAGRTPSKLDAVAAEIGGHAFVADAADPVAVEALFEEAEARLGPIDVVVYNGAARARGRLAELDPADVQRAIVGSAFAGFLVAQQAAKRMVPRGHGAILLTGATASVKGFALSAPFAMGKFALRGLAQSASRELAPQGIHVAHVIVDGGIRSPTRPDPVDRPDSTLDPDAIAQTYLHLLQQPRSAWSWEIEVRPWTEIY